MKLAILSDIHDNVWNLRAALAACSDSDSLICCGDLCSPFVVSLLGQGFAGPIHIVFGNNDGDLYRITQNAARFDGRVRLHGQFADLPAGEFGAHIAVNHYPDIAEAIAASGKYELVCYGHDHKLRVEIRPGATSLINPGPIMGYEPVAAVEVRATFVLLDTERMCGHIVEVSPGTAMKMRPIGSAEAEP